jgi:hypothetical protein
MVQGRVPKSLSHTSVASRFSFLLLWPRRPVKKSGHTVQPATVRAQRHPQNRSGDRKDNANQYKTISWLANFVRATVYVRLCRGTAFGIGMRQTSPAVCRPPIVEHRAQRLAGLQSLPALPLPPQPASCSRNAPQILALHGRKSIRGNYSQSHRVPADRTR